jgi:hypothetical protein
MKPYRLRHTDRDEPSADTLQLTQLINRAAQNLGTIGEQQKRIGPMLTPEAGKALQVYLTIAKNSLAEARKFLGSRRLVEAWQRMELVDKELAFSHHIIEKHESVSREIGSKQR